MPGDGNEGGGNAAGSEQLLNGGVANQGGGEKKPEGGEGGGEKKPEPLLNGGEKKPEGGEKKPEDGKKPEDEKKPEGAPEKYEDFKFPDGVKVDTAAVAGFQELAKKLNLSQEKAQELVTFQAGMIQKAQEAAQAEWDKIEKGWLAAAKSDKEIGGADFDKNVGLANRAIQTFAGANTQKFVEAITGTGLGNHPEMIRFLVNAAKAVGEDKLVGGEAKVAQGFDAKSLYSKSNMS